MKTHWLRNAVAAGLFFCVLSARAFAESPAPTDLDKRIEELERSVRELTDQLKHLKEERDAEREAAQKDRETLHELSAQYEEIKQSDLLYADSWVNKFTLGGYGEFHANFEEGPGRDQFDIHRLVLYLGYDFTDWIKFNSEMEIEHAFVSSESDGELSLEQAYVDFFLSDPVNVRVGRVLTPIGIINKKHEPPSFYGVERPSVDRVIIPTTWSSDGAGVFGSITPSLKYETYVVGSLDGSQFDDLNGIRNGRIKERPSLHEPAFTGRLDFYPFAQREAGLGQWLRLGASTFVGGLDNANRGRDPGVNAEIQVYSGDFEYTIADFDFRGVIAFENIDGAREIGNGVAEEIFGWYLEGAYHYWPERWKTGKLARSDAVAFVRYDDFDTQHDMPSGVPENPAGDRNEWTVGTSFYFLPNLVLKADYQFRDSQGEDPGDAFNLGLGWQF